LDRRQRRGRPVALRVGSVSIIRSPLATLPRRLPGVVRITELTLGQVIQALLFAPEHVELVLALFGIDRGGVDLRGLISLGRRTATE
jgi:hypothetical protein